MGNVRSAIKPYSLAQTPQDKKKYKDLYDWLYNDYHRNSGQCTSKCTHYCDCNVCEKRKFKEPLENGSCLLPRHALVWTVFGLLWMLFIGSVYDIDTNYLNKHIECRVIKVSYENIEDFINDWKTSISFKHPESDRCFNRASFRTSFEGRPFQQKPETVPCLYRLTDGICAVELEPGYTYDILLGAGASSFLVFLFPISTTVCVQCCYYYSRMSQRKMKIKKVD